MIGGLQAAALPIGIAALSELVGIVFLVAAAVRKS